MRINFTVKINQTKVPSKGTFCHLIGRYYFKETQLTPTNHEILQSYNSFGFIETVLRLVGSFAIIIIDTKIEKAYIATDPFGSIPIHIHRDKASKSLIVDLFIKNIIKQVTNPLGLNFQYLFSREDSETSLQATIYDSIYKLPAGKSLEVSTRSLQFNCTEYWSLHKHSSFNLSTFKNSSVENLPLQYKDLISESCKSLLQPVPSILCSLSGGFDSSILAILSQNSTSLEATTICTETSVLNDEIHRAIEITEAYKVSHKVVLRFLDDEPEPNHWLQALFLSQNPKLNYETFLKSYIFSTSDDTGLSSYYLSGTGSDQYNGGTTSFDYAENGLHTSWEEFISTLQVKSFLSNKLSGGNLFHQFSKPILNPSLSFKEDKKTSWRNYIHNNHNFLINKALPTESNLSLSSGRIPIYPFLNTEILHFLSSIPPKYHPELFFKKTILRRGFENILPLSYRSKNKFHLIPFARQKIFIFYQKLLAAENQKLFKLSINNSPVVEKLFDIDILSALVNDAISSKFFPAMQHIFYIINLGLLDGYFQGRIELPEFSDNKRLVENSTSVKGKLGNLKHLQLDKHSNINRDHIIRFICPLKIAQDLAGPTFYIFDQKDFLFTTSEPVTIDILKAIDGQHSGREIASLLHIDIEKAFEFIEYLWTENIIEIVR